MAFRITGAAATPFRAPTVAARQGYAEIQAVAAYISPAAAAYQIGRIARLRGIAPAALRYEVFLTRQEALRWLASTGHFL